MTNLTEILAEHRMNAVVEGAFYVKTRVKCDGHTCDFYAEGERYWDVVEKHDAHLAEVLEPFIRAERAAALDEASAAFLRWATSAGMNSRAVARWLTARAEAERRGES